MGYDNYTDEELDNEIEYLESKILGLQSTSLIYIANPELAALGIEYSSQAAQLECELAEAKAERNRRSKAR